MLTRIEYVGGGKPPQAVQIGTSGTIIKGGVTTNLFMIDKPPNTRLIIQFDGLSFSFSWFYYCIPEYMLGAVFFFGMISW